ncbi:MAG: OmpH family outer membrane protein [Gammaproteobacteria bacterium]
MTIKFTLPILLLLGFVAPGVEAAGKSAFLNPAIIMERSPQAKAASKALENEFKERDLKLRADANSIKQMEDTYQKDNAIMSAEQKKKTEEAIIQKKRKFQFDQQSIKEDLQIRRQQVIQELQQSISAVIRQYGKDNEYDFIFTEGVAYASDSVNITDEILEELSK